MDKPPDLTSPSSDSDLSGKESESIEIQSDPNTDKNTNPPGLETPSETPTGKKDDSFANSTTSEPEGKPKEPEEPEKPPAVSKTTKILAIVMLLVIGGMGAFYFFSNGEGISLSGESEIEPTPEEIEDTSSEQLNLLNSMEEELPVGGIYENYDEFKLQNANSGEVVLFFHADWCPTCNAVNVDILNNLDNIPEDVTILKVDYDSEGELRDKYGVTYQHTFVQVDESGNPLNNWLGSITLDQILENVV